MPGTVISIVFRGCEHIVLGDPWFRGLARAWRCHTGVPREQDKEDDLTEFLALGGPIPTTVRNDPSHGPEHACSAYPRKKQDKEDDLIGVSALGGPDP